MKTTTILGLPGSGKSTLCQYLAKLYNSSWRPEPTEDIDYLNNNCQTGRVNRIILNRFLIIDASNKHQFLDSDYYTAKYIFGGTSNFDELLAPISQNLLLLLVSPEQQTANILKRNRSFAKQELQYTKPFWHDRLEAAFDSHPAPNKYVVIPDKEPFTWKYYT